MFKKYKVTKNGKFKFAGTHNECFAFILNNQGQSVHHAVTYEGWNITDSNNSNSVTKNIKKKKQYREKRVLMSTKKDISQNYKKTLMEKT